MHGQRAGLGGLRNEYARGPLRYGLSGSERTGFSDRWCSRGIVLGESSSKPERQFVIKQSASQNERKERHVRCAKQEQCREDKLQG